VQNRLTAEKPVRITSLEIENVKRVSAVELDIANGLTVIGGRNGQGKTSILDAIMWALGGDRYRPSNAVHNGEEEAYIKVELDNGVTVERKGVNGALKVTSANGKGGQSLLNEFVNLFALNLPKFMASTGIEKAKLLLDAFPELGVQLQKLNEQHKKLYDERHGLGVIADQKAKYAKELPYATTAPELPLSGADMAARMQEACSHNARCAAIRQQAVNAADSLKGHQLRVDSLTKRVKDLEQSYNEARKDLCEAQARVVGLTQALTAATQTAAAAKEQDITAIQTELEQIDALNARVRANESKRHAEAEAGELREQYNAASAKLEEVRTERMKLLASVALPLESLSIDDEGELVYRGQRWDCMSGAEQLRVATAICAAMKPECGFVLLDKLEAMDTETLAEFAGWLQERNLQAIGTRVGTGAECSIIIDDGHAVNAPAAKRKLAF